MSLLLPLVMVVPSRTSGNGTGTTVDFILLSCLMFLYAIVSSNAIHPNPHLQLHSDCFYLQEMPRKQFLLF